jgi:hypothetical protein
MAAVQSCGLDTGLRKVYKRVKEIIRAGIENTGYEGGLLFLPLVQVIIGGFLSLLIYKRPI